MARLEWFENGQRVLVHAVIPRPHQDTVPLPFPVRGVVHRLLSRDDSAWVRLEHRLDPELKAHPFPLTDPHGRNCDVLAWPEDCELDADGAP